jgi:hypothetical protein
MDLTHSHSDHRFRVSAVSGFGVFVAETIAYPFELLGTIIKSQHKRTPILSTAKVLLSEKGVLSLYKGCSTLFWTTFLPNIAYFYIYDSLNDFAVNYVNKYFGIGAAHYIPPLSSFLAETVYVLLSVPADTVQTRMQLGSNDYQYNGLLKGVADIIRKEGLVRLFSASYLYIMQLVIYTPMQFTIYEWLKMSKLNKSENKDYITYLKSVQFTFLATSCAAIVTNPINTLVVRYQITDFTSNEGKGLNGWRILMKSLKKYGFRDLNRGMCARLLQTNINSMVFLPIYEMSRQHYNSKAGH